MNVTRTQSQSVVLHDAPPPPPPQGQEGLEFIANGQARASQQQVLEKVNQRLGDRALSLEQVISGRGLEAVIGRATAYAKVKDAFVRAFHRGTTGLGDGSNHRAAIRLAEAYARLKESGAPEGEKEAVLRELLTKLETTRANKKITPGSPQDRIGDMITFVEKELGTLPAAHRREAERLTGEYHEAREKSSPIPVKLELLTRLRDHLIAADPEGVDLELTEQLRLVEEDLRQLGTHQPLKEELVAFTQKGGPGLRPTQTREGSLVEDLRAREKHQRFLETISAREDDVPGRRSITRESLVTAREKLKPTLTREVTGLEHAQQVFLENSLRPGVAPGVIKENPGALQDPTLAVLRPETLESEAFREIGVALREALSAGNHEALPALWERLGQLIADDLALAPREVQLAFATTRGQAFQEELLQALLTRMGGDPAPLASPLESAPRELRHFFSQVYLHAARHLPDHQTEDGSIVLNGRTFTLERHLNSGALGKVDLYVARWTEEIDGVTVEKEERVAVKSSLIASLPGMDQDTIDDQFAPMALEARAHMAAQGEGHPNVLGLKGVVQAPNGSLLMVMDLAPHGDVSDLARGVARAEKEGLISPRAATLVRLTAIRDMLLGMQHVQEERGMIHLDIKPANFLVGEGGRVKVGDFGQSLVTTSRRFQGLPIDNITHLAPEVVNQARAILKEKGDIRDQERHLRSLAAKEAARLPREEAELLLASVEETIRQLIELRTSEEQGYTITGRQDIWALGISAYQLFHNDLSPFAPEDEQDREYMKKMEAEVAEFGRDLSNRIGTLGTDGAGHLVGTGATELDRLLNQMLDPDPERRPSITELLASPIFREPGIGSPEVRDLLMLLNQKDAPPGELERVSRAIGV